MNKIFVICNLIFGTCLEIVCCNLLFKFPVYAGNNIIITCDNSSCTKSTNSPLFSETNIYPSYSVSQTTTIKNNRNAQCNLSFKTINNSQNILLSDVINIKNYDSQNNWYDNTLKSLFDNQYHTLGTVNSGSSKDIIWTATFDRNAGNIYQNISTNFDIDFNFSCDEETTSTTSITTTTPTSTPVPTIIPASVLAVNRTINIVIPTPTPAQSVLGTQDIKSTCNFDLRYLFVFVSLIFLNIIFRSKKLFALSIILIILSLYYFRCIFDIFSFPKLLSILN